MKDKKVVTKTDLLTTPSEFFKLHVNEALKARRVNTYPQVETYLIKLLGFFLDVRNLYSEDEGGKKQRQLLSELLLRAMNADNSSRLDLLKKLGDSSLYICGFFGPSLNRKLVDVDYYVDMGTIAYESLSVEVQGDIDARVYRIFAEKFVTFVDVLEHISHEIMIHNNEDLLRLYERYILTGSELVKERLIEKGITNIDVSRQFKGSKQ